MGRHDKHAAAISIIAVQSVDLGDYLHFKVDRTAALDELVDALAVGYRADASLGGRRSEQLIVDVRSVVSTRSIRTSFRAQAFWSLRKLKQCGRGNSVDPPCRRGASSACMGRQADPTASQESR